VKILYTGGFAVGSLTELRRQALIELGHDVTGVDRFEYERRGPKFFRKLRNHMLIGPGVRAYNRRLVEEARSQQFDFIYIDIANWLYPNTVRELSATGAKTISYTSEHFTHLRHIYRRFWKSVHLYDMHVVTFPTAGDILLERGAKRVEFTEFGYDPILHNALPVEPITRDIVFIGHWEPHYEQHVKTLRDAGTTVDVFGPGWRRARSLDDSSAIRPVFGEEYARVLKSSKICLGLLTRFGDGNHWSGSRTFEIPAVGRMLLAMRSKAQQDYFEEGTEAEYFSDDAELIRKAKHYLANDQEREAIAAGGLKRAKTSEYTHLDRVRQMLTRITG
jgi:spore maturation protein CgeB